ncbi:MAG: hypothetical protein ACNA78_05040 [Balneolaceae bacterium]
MFLKITTTLFALAIMIFFVETTCQDLGENCIATANYAYENGEYTEAMWDLFVNNLCPNAELECYLQKMD